MSPFWHPLSAVYLDEPRVLASPTVLRLLLAGEGRALVRYAGDRMWPALRHGQALQITPIPGAGAAEGDVVLALDGGILDILRVERAREPLELAPDAAVEPARRVEGRDLVGLAAGAGRGGRARGWLRLGLDLREAWVGRPDGGADAASGVRDKYDEQAVHYARGEGEALPAELTARIATAIPRGGRVLVAGSGSGKETFALEDLGYEVVGVDFAPRMVERAREEAARRGSHAVFAARDLKDHVEPPGSLAGVVFTADVYSFIPREADRSAVLARLRDSLAEGGALFLSARRRASWEDRVMLTVQWVAARLRRAPTVWGDSHTRWLDGSGRLRRSFVHVFTPRSLDAELRRAGFSPVEWSGGHGLYRPRSGA